MNEAQGPSLFSNFFRWRADRVEKDGHTQNFQNRSLSRQFGMRRKIRARKAKIREPSPSSNDSDPLDCKGYYGVERHVLDCWLGPQPDERHGVCNGGDGGQQTAELLGFDEAGLCTDWVKLEACVICDGNEDPLLICQGEDCPLVLHEKCLDNKLDFDQRGNFYCPYCWCKLKSQWHEALVDRNMVAEKPMVKEKFQCNGVMAGSKEKEKNFGGTKIQERNFECDSVGDCVHCKDETEGNERQDRFAQLGNDQETNMCTAAEDCYDYHRDIVFVGHLADRLPLNQDGATGSTLAEAKEPLKHKHKSEILEPGNLGDGEKMPSGVAERVEESEQVKVRKQVLKGKKRIQADNPRRRSHRMHMDRVDGKQGEQRNASNGEKVKTLDSEVISPFQIPSDEGAEEGQKGIREDAQKPDASDSINASLRYSDKSAECDCLALVVYKENNLIESDRSAECDHLALVVYKGNHRQKTENKGSVLETGPSDKVFSIEEAYRGNQGCKPVDSVSAANRVGFTFVEGRRKRLFWTDEEKEMLKEGVQIFSATAHKNIPWRKILAYGRGVFHEERTPMDLKEKWKKMKRAL